MKILQLHNTYLEKGGEDTVVANERSLLESYGHEVALCDFHNRELDELGPLSQLQRTLYNRKSFRKVIRCIQDFRPDVIHIHNIFYEASSSVFWAIAKANIPAVLTLHNFRFGCVQGLAFRNNAVCTLCLEKKSTWDGIKNRCFQDSLLKSFHLSVVNRINYSAMRKANSIKKFIFLAEFNKNLLSGALPIRDDNWVVKSNHVEDRGVAGPENRSDFYLFVGRTNEQKGIHLLVESFVQSGRKLEVIGSGPLDERLQRMAEGHPNIVLHGHQTEYFIVDRLKQCRAMILPTLTLEGQPMTVLEAFSTGTPAFASNIQNLDSMISTGENGFLFEKGNMQDLTNRIEQFEKLGGEDRKRIHDNARSSYERNYSPESNYKQLMAIYHSVMQAAVNDRHVPFDSITAGAGLTQ